MKFIIENWHTLLIVTASLTGLVLIILFLRAYHGEGETDTTKGAEAVRGPRVYAESETLDVAQLYREGITRHALRVTVRDLRAHGTHVTLINRPGLMHFHDGFIGWITGRGKLLMFSWGGK